MNIYGVLNIKSWKLLSCFPPLILDPVYIEWLIELVQCICSAKSVIVTGACPSGYTFLLVNQ